MAEQQAFDPQAFLDKVGAGRTVVTYPKQRLIFTQGEAAEAVFYLQEGQVKLTVVSA
jgi:CRP/FNR family cyclic AMP-dependent transcriptional regulator